MLEKQKDYVLLRVPVSNIHDTFLTLMAREFGYKGKASFCRMIIEEWLDAARHHPKWKQIEQTMKLDFIDYKDPMIPDVAENLAAEKWKAREQWAAQQEEEDGIEPTKFEEDF